MSLSTPRRIAVFGGAFDPPHRAHLALAQAALTQLQLDELRVIPTGQAWHKERPLSPAHHRLAMTRLAFASCPQAVVDGREMQRAGNTYTFDTLQALRLEQPNAQWWLLIGEDQALRFTTWHRWRELLDQVQLVVADRPESAAETGADHERALRGQWHNALPDAVRQHMQVLRWVPQSVSATAIRHAVQTGQDASMGLQPPVLQYIQQHHLYSDNHE